VESRSKWVWDQMGHIWGQIRVCEDYSVGPSRTAIHKLTHIFNQNNVSARVYLRD